jgi:hypothetical protein
MQMNKDNYTPRRGHIVNHAATGIEQMELYCADHPRSPSAARRPKLFVRSDLWIALLGPSLEAGIVGIGPTVAAALRAFDTQYLAGQQLPNETISPSIKPSRSFTVRLRQAPEC